MCNTNPTHFSQVKAIIDPYAATRFVLDANSVG
jgi:hypothetical protein